MYSKLFLFFALSATLLAVSCKKENVVENKFTVENQKVSGPMTLTQRSFTPLTFDSNGKVITAKAVQDFSGTISTIGTLTTVINVTLDLVTGKSSDVLSTYVDKDGDKINTTSYSQSSATGLTINERIISGTGKFAKISGGGSYFVTLNFTTGNGTGTFEWTVTY